MRFAQNKGGFFVGFCDLNIKDQFGIILDIGVKVSLYGTRRAR